MPLQNRVDPWGKLQAVSNKGAWLGNRGILHNEDKKIVTDWRGKAWITCQIRFKDRTSVVFAPDSYTQLFFVDEATAFAAGHRPCAECRRDRYNEFKAAWIRANRDKVQAEDPTIAEMDKVIHAERVTDGRSKRTFDAPIGNLPQGTVVQIGEKALLLWRGKLLPWSFDGYGRSEASASPSTVVKVITPASIVNMFASGFMPQVHPSGYN